MPILHKPEQVTLSNGIPVLLQQYDGPAAATYWWVRAGSADESKDEAGYAHFLEHMLFKDAAAKETGRASTGQMARAIESLGGDINAYTSFDQTVYHVTCAAQHWEKIIDAFGPIAKPQRFLKEDFEREREVILEELKKNEDSPDRQIFQNLFSGAFAKHPYGRPVIGFTKTLKAATVSKLEAFYRRNYVSENMGLILVGPISQHRAAILKLLEKHFGSRVIARKAAVRRPKPVEPELRKEPVFKLKSFDVKTPKLAFSFRVPSLLHADIAALDLASGILSMGELSRLYQNLFYGKSLCTDVSGGLYIPKDPGMLYFEADLTSMQQMEAVFEEILKELKRLQSDDVTDEELKRIVVNTESDRLYATQSADGMAGRLGFLKYAVGDLNYETEYLEELRSIDSAQLKKIVARYFDLRRLTVSVLVPESEKNYDLSPLKKLAQRYLAAPVEAPQPKAKKSARPSARLSGDLAPRYFTRPSGLRVVHRENQSSHVVSVSAAVLGGLRLELTQPSSVSGQSDWGASHLMALTWTKGTSRLDSRGIARIVEGSAARLDGFSGRHTVGLQLAGLVRDWEPLSEIFAEVLADPVFPHEEFEHSRRVAEDSIRSLEDHTSQVCSKLFLESLFEHHPYGKLTLGSLESLAQLSGQRLQQLHRQWVRPERMVVSLSGNIRGSQLDRLLDAIEARMGLAGQGGISAPIKELELPSEPALKGPRWVERELGREQTHIIVGGLGLTMKSEEKLALRLLTTILGGQSGRLFIELREKKSLAYTVAPMSFEGMEAGYVGTYIACSPSKRQESIEGIRKVLETAASSGKGGLTAVELKRAQEYHLGRRAMDMQSDGAIASHLGLEHLYGLPYETEAEIAEAVRAVSLDQIRAVCRKYWVEPFTVTSVVG